MVIARKRAFPKAKSFDETPLLPGLFPEEFHPEILLPFKSTYATHRGAIYTADALVAMKLMPQQCIDLLITSPPYALHFKKRNTEMPKKRNTSTGSAPSLKKSIESSNRKAASY